MKKELIYKVDGRVTFETEIGELHFDNREREGSLHDFLTITEERVNRMMMLCKEIGTLDEDYHENQWDDPALYHFEDDEGDIYISNEDLYLLSGSQQAKKESKSNGIIQEPPLAISTNALSCTLYGVIQFITEEGSLYYGFWGEEFDLKPFFNIKFDEVIDMIDQCKTEGIKLPVSESRKLIYAEYVFWDKDNILHIAKEDSYFEKETDNMEEDIDEVEEDE